MIGEFMRFFCMCHTLFELGSLHCRFGWLLVSFPVVALLVRIGSSSYVFFLLLPLPSAIWKES